jgi:hypothetical protein
VSKEFKQGDEVEWNTPQGKTRGTVKKKLTSRTEVGGQTVAPLRRTLATSSRAQRAVKRQPTSLRR